MPEFNKVLGDYLGVRPALGPVAGSGSAQNGQWVDRLGFLSALAVVQTQLGGGATGGNLTVKIQDATDASGTAAADYSSNVVRPYPAGPNAQVAEKISFDLNGARQFVRLVVTSAPTGGTPTSQVSATLILGNTDRLPAA